ncbi:MAG TPA: LysR substrate-binding domain-containing protein [Deltaproteobacteria bacterium]|nr:LysR substrate-binding domain-containing protein [Deltaproteobacteria bacterium]HOM28181.1 LysR substrate-binding domain-containing protein [Deltaproteobacteria bacterium]HPP79847.1 LysR substrate-binding domain-containing protein [Deltaproteobacteria bacterium]
MNIHQVHIFNVAAKTLSITKTAKKMNLSQPSVSIQIKDLEDSLGVRLFDRINRRITLTDAGKVFLDYSERLLRLIEEIEASMKGFSSGDAGRVVIGASSTVGVYVLPRFLGEFKERYPKAEISLNIMNRKEAVEQCLAGSLDFAFMQDPPRHADLDVEFFMKDELLIVCSPRHRWAQNEFLTMKTLSTEPEPIILREEGSGTRALIEYVLKRYGIERKVTMELSSSEGIKRAVEANLGVAVLSKSVVSKEVDAGTLVALPIRDLDTVREFYIVRNRKRASLPLVERFGEFILSCREKIAPIPG